VIACSAAIRRPKAVTMSKAKNLTLDDLPLFANDEQIGEAVLGWERRKEFKALAVLHEREGMPKVSPVWGGRYVPAVKACLDSQYGLSTAVPLAPNGVEEVFMPADEGEVRVLG
jgi:hypothetical protein